MKNQSLYVAVLAGAATLVSLVIGTAHRAPLMVDARMANDAAYRDGLYLAQLDATQKRPAHIISGRWATTEDRASFIAGYVHGYQDQTGHQIKLAPGDVATLTGYSEGMADGAHDRKALLPFHVRQSERVRQAELVYGQLATVYRQAYANGYQRAYYATDAATVRAVGQPTEQF